MVISEKAHETFHGSQLRVSVAHPSILLVFEDTELIASFLDWKFWRKL